LSARVLLGKRTHAAFYDDELYDALTCPKQIVRFTEAAGADWHCEPAAKSLRDERVFDWLEETLGVNS
jgi:hypothetical protein